MKIIETVEYTVICVETDKKEFPTYRRLSADSWENLMGESWEPAYFEEKELEAAYQEFLRSNAKVIYADSRPLD